MLKMARKIKKGDKKAMSSFIKYLLIALLMAAVAFGIIIVLKSRGISALDFLKNFLTQKG